MTQVRRIDQIPQAGPAESSDVIVLHQEGRTRRSSLGDLNLFAGSETAAALAPLQAAASSAQSSAAASAASSAQAVGLVNSLGLPTIVSDLSDAKKRLDQPWGNSIVYYGANRDSSNNGPAFQAAADSGFINIPPGGWECNQPIVAGSGPLQIRGSGTYQGGSRVLSKHSGDLIDFDGRGGRGGDPAYASLDVRDVGFYTTGLGPNICIIAKQRSTGVGFNMENVRFGSFSASFQWARMVDAEGTTRTTMRRVFGDGGSYESGAGLNTATQIGMVFRSPSGDRPIYVITFENCDISAALHGIKFEVQGNEMSGGTIEGITFRNCGGRSVRGATIRFEQPAERGAWNCPYFIMQNCNFEGPGTVLDIDAISSFHMHDCLHYCARRTPDAGPVNDYIRLRRVDSAFIHGNELRAYAGAQIANFISIGSGSADVHLGPNIYALENGYTDGQGVARPKAIATGGVFIDPAATGVTYNAGSKFKFWPDGLPKITGGTLI